MHVLIKLISENLSLRIVIVFLIFFYFPECNIDQEHNNKYPFELLKIGSKCFLLDDDTGPMSLNVNYIESNNKAFYTHYNKYRSKFLIYDYNSCKFITKISLDNYPEPSSASFYNFDSVIFCYDNADKNTILICDTNGRLVNRFDPKIIPFEYVDRSITGDNFNPFLFRGNKIFYTRVLLTERVPKSEKFNRCLGGEYNLETGQRKNFVYFPDIYFTAYWGYTHYRRLFNCFNEKEMIVSFPASDYLFKYNLSSFETDSIKATSIYFPGITPNSKNIMADLDMKKSDLYYLRNPSYGPVYYDKYRNVYYRVAEMPKYKNEIKSDSYSDAIKPKSIIILDSALNIIGETVIGDKYRIYCTLVTPDGLLLNKIDDDEAQTTYDIFSLQKMK